MWAPLPEMGLSGNLCQNLKVFQGWSRGELEFQNGAEQGAHLPASEVTQGEGGK